MLAAARPAGAAWPSDPTTNLPVSTNECDAQPDVVSDGAGGAIVAWADYRGTTQDIYAQHILAGGSIDPAWPAGGVAICLAGHDQNRPTLISDNAGGAILAWEDRRGAQFDADLYGQHLRANGTVDPAWPADGRAIVVATGEQVYPKLMSDGGGGAIVAWVDGRISTANNDLYAQHLQAAGAVDPAWPANGRMLCGAPGNQYAPSIATDGAGGAIVSWEDQRTGGWSTADIYAQRVLAGGAVDPDWPADGSALCTAGSWQAGAQILADGAGGAMVTWQDNRNSTRIYVQRVDSNGDRWPGWPVNGRIVCGYPSVQVSPLITTDGGDGALVAWVDTRNGSGGLGDVCVQHVLGGGTVDATWPLDGVELSSLGGVQQWGLGLLPDGAGGAIATWQDHRSGSSDDVYAHRALANGTADPLWPGNGRAMGTAAGDQVAPRTTSDGAGGIISAWEDYRTGSCNIYAQRVGADGQLGGSTAAVEPVVAGSLELEPASPNPCRPGTIRACFTLPAAGVASLDLVDAAGRRVGGREAGPLGAGTHAVELEVGDHLPSGVYYLRLSEGTDVRMTRVTLLR